MQKYKNTFQVIQQEGLVYIQTQGKKINSILFTGSPNGYAYRINVLEGDGGYNAFTVYGGQKKLFKGNQNEYYAGIIFIVVYPWARFAPPPAPRPRPDINIILKELL